MSEFELALADIASAWPAFVPPNRVAVSRGAADALIISRPGGGSGPWRPELTPYMIEPTDMLASRRHSAVCFVGPSQTGKTVALGEGWLAHAVTNDPGDMLIVQMTQDKAREYSKQRIDRALRNSPKLRALMGAAGKDDNLHDKAFRNGMMLKIGWPTGSNLASTSYRYVFGTDYDRWDDDIDGEGDGFTQMGKRVTTFLSRGMVGVESSPGRPVTDPNWTPSTPHEAPPVTGVLGVYNRSDRRRLYWKCPHCGEHLQAAPGLGLFQLPSDDELLESIRTLNIDRFAQQYARVICPTGCLIQPKMRERMNLGGRWLADGLTIDALDRISGNPRTSSIAGFWLGGVAATYIHWEALIRKHLQALLEYALTGSELPLQTTTNTDQGLPYMSRHLVEASRTGNKPKDRAEEGLLQYVVPDAARFLVAFVDVQGGRNARFIVQVHAIGEHQEQWLIDRYAITESRRKGYGGFAPLDPAGHIEDWDLITERVVKATYRTSDPDRELRMRMTLVDTGGEDGVTARAYEWWRGLRRKRLHRRVELTKGEKGRYNWLIRETMVGNTTPAKSDVPLKLLNSNLLKDAVFAGLKRQVPGPNYYHFPKPFDEDKNPDGWLLPTFFEELEAETRNPDGTYTQHKARNEAIDCCYGIKAGCIILGADKPKFWANPPSWALPLDRNSDVIAPEERRAERKADAEAAAVAPPVEEKPAQKPAVERRTRRSSYMG